MFAIALALAPTPVSAIANGVETFDQASTVALLIAAQPIFPSGVFCSGVLIGCSTVLTSAHCVCGGDVGNQCQTGSTSLADPSTIDVAMQHGPTRGVASVHVPVGYQFETAQDVAVLKLVESVDGIRPTPINDSFTVTFGSLGTLVGYGITDLTLTDVGSKRQGQIETSACPPPASDSEHLCWTFPGTAAAGPPGTESNACPGDSGGPLFVDFGSGPRVAGVTSGGIDSCHTSDSAFDSDVFVNRAFVQMVGGSDLDAVSCGTLPQAGQAGTTIIPFSGTIGDPPGASAFAAAAGPIDFEVAPGTALLRVNLNGAFLGGTDLDLAIRQGSPPTAEEFDCAPGLPSSFEACEIEDPVPGTWHGAVSLASGTGGPYQVVVTTFVPEPSRPALLLSSCGCLFCLGSLRRPPPVRAGSGTLPASIAQRSLP